MHAPMSYRTGFSQPGRGRWAPWHKASRGASVAALGLAIVGPAAQATTFDCADGNVDCLIESIKQANVQPGSSHDIGLAAGVYTLTAVENDTDGPNGLPSVTSRLTIRGAGEDVTILERAG